MFRHPRSGPAAKGFPHPIRIGAAPAPTSCLGASRRLPKRQAYLGFLTNGLTLVGVRGSATSLRRSLVNDIANSDPRRA